MLNRDEDILQAAENWQKAGHGVALATLVWKYQVEPTDELLAMQERAASGLMFLFDRARTDGQLLLVRGRRDDGELRDEVSNDSCTGFFFGAYYLARLGAPHLRE